MTVTRKLDYNTQCRLRDRVLSLAGITTAIPNNKAATKMFYVLRSPKSTLRLVVSRGTAALRRSLSQEKEPSSTKTKAPRTPLRTSKEPTTPKYNEDIGFDIDDYSVPVIVLTTPSGKNTPLRTIPKFHGMHRRMAYKNQKNVWQHSAFLSPAWVPRPRCVDCEKKQFRAYVPARRFRNKRAQEADNYDNSENTKRVRVTRNSERYENQWLPSIKPYDVTRQRKIC